MKFKNINWLFFFAHSVLLYFKGLDISKLAQNLT